MRRPALSFALALLVTLPGLAQEPAPPPALDDAIRKAVAGKRLEDSGNLGPQSASASYREVNAEGAVLVGLEVALAKWSDSEIPYAFRPIYRSGDREWTGRSAGNMNAEQVRRRVRVVAKPDYAVGGMWVRTGAAMDRLSLVFMRVRADRLDAADSYASEWVGTSDGGSAHYIDGRGQPVVGLFADAGRDQVHSVGLVSARVAVVPPKPKPKEPPPEDWTDDGAPAIDEPQPGKKSNLELEADALREQQEAEGIGTGMLVLILVGAIGIPFAVIVYFVLGKKESDPIEILEKKEPAETPKQSSRVPGRPVSERPELAKRLQPYLPAVVSTTTLTTARLQRSSGEPPPSFFLVRATYRARRDRLTRIYVLPGELLVVDAGRGADQNVAAGLAAAAAMGGGIIGAIVGEQVANMVADTQKAGGQALQQRLDRLDLAALLVKATEEGNFRARFEDIAGMSIDSPGQTRWGEMSRGVGTFRFRHLRRGEYSFDFLNGAEIRGAIQLLRRTSQGANLQIGTDWDESTAAYLADL